MINLCSFDALKAGTKASARTTVSSLQMLALQVYFGDHTQVKMLPSFLRCFPNLETLIVESFLEENTSNRRLKFWQETSPIECVQSHLKTLSFCELQGNDSEFDFIMFVVENAPKLERLIIQIKLDLTYTERWLPNWGILVVLIGPTQTAKCDSRSAAILSEVLGASKRDQICLLMILFPASELKHACILRRPSFYKKRKCSACSIHSGQWFWLLECALWRLGRVLLDRVLLLLAWVALFAKFICSIFYLEPTWSCCCYRNDDWCNQCHVFRWCCITKLCSG